MLYITRLHSPDANTQQATGTANKQQPNINTQRTNIRFSKSNLEQTHTTRHHTTKPRPLYTDPVLISLKR